MIRKSRKRWWAVIQGARDPFSDQRSQLSGSAATEREAVRLERQLWSRPRAQKTGLVTLAQLVAEW